MISLLSTRIGPTLRRALLLLLALAMMGLPLYALPELSPTEPARPEPASRSAISGGDIASSRTTSGALASPQEMTVDEILAEHYEAIGGDHHQQVQTMKMVGRSVVMGMEAPYTRYSKRPNKVLLEIYVQDMTGIQAFDGEIAWGYMPFMGQTAPAALPPEQTRVMLEGSDFDGSLAQAKEKGHKVELLGIEPVNGRDAYKLRLTMKTGGVQVHYVDAETFYLTRLESDAGTSVMRDYRLVEGHPVPSVIEIMGPMGEQIVYVDDVELGVEIDDAAFSMQ